MKRGRGRPPGSSPEQIARCRAMIAYHDGGLRTLKEVGDRFGVTRERVRQILDKSGIEVRRGNRDFTAEHQRRFDAYRAALTPGVRAFAAAKAIGCTVGDVRNAAEALGLKLPRPVTPGRLRFYKIAAFYAANPHLTGRKVAEHFGVSQNMVSDALQQTGTPSRRSGWSWKASHAERQQAAA